MIHTEAVTMEIYLLVMLQSSQQVELSGGQRSKTFLTH